MRLKCGANEIVAVVCLSVGAVISAGLIAAWQAGVFDRAQEQIESSLQTERGSMISPGECEDGLVAATAQNVWSRPRNTDQTVTGAAARGKRVQISAELDEAVYGMDFNADGDTKDVIPRLPDRPAADDREWLDTPGGIVIGSKHFGNTDFGARISERTIPLFSYRDLLYHSAASTDLRKLRDVSRNTNNHIGYFWNIREADILDRLAPANPGVPAEHRKPPTLPAVAVPLVNTNGNPIAGELSFNAQIVVDKTAGCWTIQYDRPLEIQCADGTDTCFTGHDFEYLTASFTEDVGIVFIYPTPEIVLREGVNFNSARNFAGNVSESGHTITCGAITTGVSSGVFVRKDAGLPCSYTLGGKQNTDVNGEQEIQIHFTSSSGAERTVSIPVHLSNIRYDAPDTVNVPIGGQASVTLEPTDGSFPVTCGDNTATLPAGVSVSRTGCEYTISAAATAAPVAWTARFDLTSTGGGRDVRPSSFVFNVAAAQPSNIVFDPGAYAAPGPSLAVGQRLTLDVSGFATDGSHTINCASGTASALIAVFSQTDCAVEIQPGTATGSATFTIDYSSTGGDTETGTFHLTIEPETPKTMATRYAIPNISGVAPTLSGWQELSGGTWQTVTLACIPNDPTVTMTAIAGQPNSYFVAISVEYTSGCSGKVVRPLLQFRGPDGVTPAPIRSYIFNLR